MINLSLVIPCYNEAQNIFNLINELILNLENITYEIIIIDDNSTDESKAIYDKIDNDNINIYFNKRNMGQSFSIYKGVKLSSYNTIVTLDGDGQNDPKDIKNLIENYFNNFEIKLVSGIRVNRKDTFSKIIASKIANKIRALILKDHCPDTGCSLKIFEKKIFLRFKYFDGIHRFIPSLFEGFGYKVKYINVNHRKRLKGKSNYNNTQRLFKGIYDIIRVRNILNSVNKNL